MSNNELLKAINFLPLEGVHAWFQPALRAVVELHRPVKYKTVLHIRTGCACGAARYPCSTIQVIEQELV